MPSTLMSACAANGANKLKEAPATNICWKSFILPHTENTHSTRAD